MTTINTNLFLSTYLNKQHLRNTDGLFSSVMECLLNEVGLSTMSCERVRRRLMANRTSSQQHTKNSFSLP